MNSANTRRLYEKDIWYRTLNHFYYSLQTKLRAAHTLMQKKTFSYMLVYTIVRKTARPLNLSYISIYAYIYHIYTHTKDLLMCNRLFLSTLSFYAVTYTFKLYIYVIYLCMYLRKVFKVCVYAKRARFFSLLICFRLDINFFLFNKSCE